MSNVAARPVCKERIKAEAESKEPKLLGSHQS